MKTSDPVPLCVDLDGTLLLSDSLLESFCRLLKSVPWLALLAPFWLLGGRAHLKKQIASRIDLDASAWPWNAEVLDYVQNARSQGRKVVLATAADRQVANAVQDRLKLFDEIVASDGSKNLSGNAKAAELVQRFGAKNFDYIGNSHSDLPCWQSARAALVVGNNGLVERVKKETPVERVFAAPGISLKDWMRALRVHQWSKNLLLLVPVMSSHQWNESFRMQGVIWGMLAFSLCASSVYLLNDLLDLENDRRHPSKRRRPFASGKIPLASGLVLAPLLLAVSATIACLLGRQFAAAFAVYYFTTLVYSLRLKQIALLDVLTLAALYDIRVMAGGAAAVVPVSNWLIMFSLFIFVSLAFVKRFTETRFSPASSPEDNDLVQGRGYVRSDSELVSSMGLGAGYLSVLVMGMYVYNPQVTLLYNRPEVLWLICPLLLYWISRVWLLAHRGAMHDDPIVFALTDAQSWIVAFLLAVVAFAAGPK